MLLIDVNVLVYAHREDADEHPMYHAWLEDEVNSDRAYGVCDLALSGFLRVVTHPRIFVTPTPLAEALRFANTLRSRDNAVVVERGPDHWRIFCDLCERVGARGNLVPDAYYAALAIESGSEWITTDGDYARFPGLRWRHPLKSAR
jgi:uncharacterized protein